MSHDTPETNALGPEGAKGAVSAESIVGAPRRVIITEKPPQHHQPDQDDFEPPPTSSTATLSQWQLIRRRFKRHRLAVVGAWMLLTLYLMAAMAEFIAPYGSGHRDLDYIYCPPQLPQFSFEHGLHTPALRQQVDPITFGKTYLADDNAIVPLGFLVRGESYRLFGLVPWDVHLFGVDHSRLESGAEGSQARFHFLGADKFGRDILSRAIYGARISLSVGLVGIMVVFLLGISIGGFSGYVGGRPDNAVQRGIEIINAFPHLPLWLALGASIPNDWSPLSTYVAITVALSLLSWTGLARVVRGKMLTLREEDYAVAARLLGASHRRVLFRHLLPGFASHIIVVLTLSIPGMILGETSLSFLGLGLRPPIVSWGVMLQDCMDIKAVTHYPWLMLPVVFIVTTVLCFNFVGDGLRDAADPYSSR